MTDKHKSECKRGFVEKKKKSQSINENTIINHISRFDVVEAYKEIRTNVIFSLLGDGSKAICITSATPSEGKTTTCINLAITFAQTGANVLIIDADLRKPKVHRNLKLHTEPGLSNVLGGFCSLAEAIQKVPDENLDVLVCGHISPNPVELLASVEMAKLLDTLKASYDYIFIDVPPINNVTDVAVISKLVSGIVLVVRQSITTFDDVNSALEKLLRVDAKILGFVINDVNERMNKKGYYKRSYYEYRSDVEEASG